MTSKGRDQRKFTRYPIKIHNAVRVITRDGDCIADIMDISENGIGLGYYDFFCALDVSKGTPVKLKFTLDLDPNLIAKQSLAASIDSESPGDEGSDPLTVEATVIWSYLNRLGLTFDSGPLPDLLEALVRRRGSRERNT